MMILLEVSLLMKKEKKNPLCFSFVYDIFGCVLQNLVEGC